MNNSVEVKVEDARFIKNGQLRFSLAITWPEGSMTVGGFRYIPEENQVLSPQFNMNKGWQDLVIAEGEWVDAAYEQLQEIAERLKPTEKEL